MIFIDSEDLLLALRERGYPTYAFEITESPDLSLSVALNQLGHLLNLVYPTGSRQELGLLFSQFYVPTIWG